MQILKIILIVILLLVGLFFAISLYSLSERINQLSVNLVEDMRVDDIPDTSTTTVQSAEHDLIKVITPIAGGLVRSPLTLTGIARGMWYFEANFGITLLNYDGVVIAQSHATADGDWMTEEFVPFIGELEFITPPTGSHGTLIFHKANASGLPEHDDEFRMPIVF
jgi:hypothetical protein